MPSIWHFFSWSQVKCESRLFEIVQSFLLHILSLSFGICLRSFLRPFVFPVCVCLSFFASSLTFSIFDFPAPEQQRKNAKMTVTDALTEKKEEGLSRKAVLSCAKRPTGNKVTTRKKMGSSILKLLSRIWLGLSFFSLTYTTKKNTRFSYLTEVKSF